MTATSYAKARVVGLDGRDGGGQQQGVAVLVLEALAGERGAPGGGPEQEPTGPGVGGRPDQVADPLEAEHRIEDVEGHHRHAPVGVGGAGGGEAGHGARLRDALLQDLAVLALGVGQQQLVVDRLVELAPAGVDLDLAEQAVHAEGAGLVGHDRHDPLAELGVAREVAQQAGEAHRRGGLLLAGPGQELVVDLGVGQRELLAQRHRARRQRAVEGLEAGVEVVVLRGALAQGDVGRHVGVECRVRHLLLEVEPVAQGAQLVLGHLLDLVGRVAALDVGAERPALDGLGQDDGGPAGGLGGGLVGGVELLVVVAATGEVAELFVGEVLDDLAQPGIGAEEVVADVARRPRPRSAGTARRRWCSSC